MLHKPILTTYLDGRFRFRCQLICRLGRDFLYFPGSRGVSGWAKSPYLTAGLKLPMFSKKSFLLNSDMQQNKQGAVVVSLPSFRMDEWSRGLRCPTSQQDRLDSHFRFHGPSLSPMWRARRYHPTRRSPSSFGRSIGSSSTVMLSQSSTSSTSGPVSSQSLPTGGSGTSPSAL